MNYISISWVYLMENNNNNYNNCYIDVKPYTTRQALLQLYLFNDTINTFISTDIPKLEIFI